VRPRGPVHEPRSVSRDPVGPGRLPKQSPLAQRLGRSIRSGRTPSSMQRPVRISTGNLFHRSGSWGSRGRTPDWPIEENIVDEPKQGLAGPILPEDLVPFAQNRCWRLS